MPRCDRCHATCADRAATDDVGVRRRSSAAERSATQWAPGTLVLCQTCHAELVRQVHHLAATFANRGGECHHARTPATVDLRHRGNMANALSQVTPTAEISTDEEIPTIAAYLETWPRESIEMVAAWPTRSSEQAEDQVAEVDLAEDLAADPLLIATKAAVAAWKVRAGYSDAMLDLEAAIGLEKQKTPHRRPLLVTADAIAAIWWKNGIHDRQTARMADLATASEQAERIAARLATPPPPPPPKK